MDKIQSFINIFNREKMGGLIVDIVLFVLVTIALLINVIQIVSLQNIGEGIAVGPRTVTNNPIHTP